MQNGRGRMIHADGSVYQGYWKNDKANGYGIFTTVNGSSYEGNWENDQ